MGVFQPDQRLGGRSVVEAAIMQQGNVSPEYQRKHGVDRFGNKLTPTAAAAANQPAASAPEAGGTAPAGARRRTRQGTILTNPGGLTPDQTKTTLLTA